MFMFKTINKNLKILLFIFVLAVPQQAFSKEKSFWKHPATIAFEVVALGAGIGTTVFCYKKAKKHNKTLVFLKELAEHLGVDEIENLTLDLLLSDDAKKFSIERDELEILSEIIKSTENYESVQNFSEEISNKNFWTKLGFAGGAILSGAGLVGLVKSFIESRKKEDNVEKDSGSTGGDKKTGKEKKEKDKKSNGSGGKSGDSKKKSFSKKKEEERRKREAKEREEKIKKLKKVK